MLKRNVPFSLNFTTYLPVWKQEKKIHPFEATLERIVGIRNHWKHEKKFF